MLTFKNNESFNGSSELVNKSIEYLFILIKDDSNPANRISEAVNIIQEFRIDYKYAHYRLFWRAVGATWFDSTKKQFGTKTNRKAWAKIANKNKGKGYKKAKTIRKKAPNKKKK